jgi:ADP-ribose pyrophosphatase
VIEKETYFQLIQDRSDLFENPEVNGLIEVKTKAEDIYIIEGTVKRRLKEKGRPESWGEVGIAYRDQYTYIIRDAVVFPNGTVGTYIRSISDNPNSHGVVILPVYQGKIVLEKHFRHATRKQELEIPRGFAEPSLSDEENARKELLEETGGIAEELTYLGSMLENTGAGSGIAKLYLAKLCSIGSPELSEGIDTLEFYTVDEIKCLISQDIIQDSYTLAALAKSGLL